MLRELAKEEGTARTEKGAYRNLKRTVFDRGKS